MVDLLKVVLKVGQIAESAAGKIIAVDVNPQQKMDLYALPSLFVKKINLDYVGMTFRPRLENVG